MISSLTYLFKQLEDIHDLRHDIKNSSKAYDYLYGDQLNILSGQCNAIEEGIEAIAGRHAYSLFDNELKYVPARSTYVVLRNRIVDAFKIMLTETREAEALSAPLTILRLYFEDHEFSAHQIEELQDALSTEATGHKLMEEVAASLYGSTRDMHRIFAADILSDGQKETASKLFTHYDPAILYRYLESGHQLFTICKDFKTLTGQRYYASLTSLLERS